MKTSKVSDLHNRYIWFGLVSIALGLVLLGSTPLFSQATDSVSVSVTLQNVAVSVTDGTVDYGTLGTSVTQGTTTSGTNDSQTATNDGNVTVNLNIRGQDTAAWTLASTAGANQYVHEFCTSNCDSTPTWTDLTTSYQTLVSSVGVSGNQVFDLQISTPTSTVSFAAQSADVTVQAVAP